MHYGISRLVRAIRPPSGKLARPHGRNALSPARHGVRLLVFVEGLHDIAFLRGISRMLHAHEPTLPDLDAEERRGALIFVPCAGAELKEWIFRLAPLGLPEFYLFDREDPPESERRRQAVEMVRLRPRCRAVMTQKRSLENYLHADAIREVSGLDMAFSADDNVADLIAGEIYAQNAPETAWETLTRPQRTKRRNRVKRWLNTRAVARMTPARLQAQDPDREVRGWLEAMRRLIATES